MATNRPAFLDGLPLTGLCLEDAEDAVNVLNKLEIACHRTARKMVEVPSRHELRAAGLISRLPRPLACLALNS